MIRLDLVLPAHNEAHTLRNSADKLWWHCQRSLRRHDWRIVLVENGSTDETWRVARETSLALTNVIAIQSTPARGNALSAAAAYALSERREAMLYMDVDLSTRLEAVRAVLDVFTSESADIVMGSRLMSGSKVTNRTLKREITSRAYNTIIRVMFPLLWRLHDAQCGFKLLGVRAMELAAREVEDRSWFWDTELLLLALRAGMTVREVPVEWVDDPDTRVRVLKTAWGDLKGLARIRSLPWR